MATASKQNVRSDTEAFLEFLAQERDVSSLSIGATGYCMGGGLSLSAAGSFPDRVLTAASYHGGNLATDDPESPHLLAPRIKARVYVAGAVEDASFPDSQKRQLTEALQAAGVTHTVETYAGAKHGWCRPIQWCTTARPPTANFARLVRADAEARASQVLSCSEPAIGRPHA